MTSYRPSSNYYLSPYLKLSVGARVLLEWFSAEIFVIVSKHGKMAINNSNVIILLVNNIFN